LILAGIVVCMEGCSKIENHEFFMDEREREREYSSRMD
jgi:hypothetical protein